jgi:triacylglycerol lipase
MAIFDYKGQDGRDIVLQANDLMMYSYHGFDDGFANAYYKYGLGLGLPLTLTSGLLGLLPSPISGTPDAEQRARETIEAKGWTVLTKEQLGYGDARVDQWGTFQGESQAEASAQVDILGRYDAQGRLTEIGVAFRGTTGPRDQLLTDTLADAINDLELTDLNYHYVDNAFSTLLAKVAAFATANGLTGGDILVTGHSLGGASVNDLADLSHNSVFPEYAFYRDSNYVAQAGFRIHDAPDVVLNIGLENDPVFRAIGAHGGLSLGVHDNQYTSSTDNIVSFNDSYASPLFPFVAFSIANVLDLFSHLPFIYGSAQERILTSDFYGKTEKDSVIVVADLSDAMRPTTWVEDKAAVTATDHGDQPVFILGSEKADLIRSHDTSDFLEGRGGDDRFILGGGQDVVLGGVGHDTVELSSGLADYNLAKLADGTVYVSAKAGDGGFDTLSSIETIQTQEWVTFLGVRLYQHGVDQAVGGIAYAETKEGGVGADTLALAGAGGGWLFGREGADILTGSGGRDHIDGGAGDDQLRGAGGDDIFIFSGHFGHDVIQDFGGHDRLDFIGVDGFKTAADVLASAHQIGNDVIISHGDDLITLMNVHLSSLDSHDFLFA